MQQSQGNGHGTQKQNRPGHRLPRWPPRSANSASLSGCGFWGSGSLFACVNFHSGKKMTCRVCARAGKGIRTHGLRSGWLRRVQRVKLDRFGLLDGRRAVGVLRGRCRHGLDVDRDVLILWFCMYRGDNRATAGNSGRLEMAVVGVGLLGTSSFVCFEVWRRNMRKLKA